MPGKISIMSHPLCFSRDGPSCLRMSSSSYQHRILAFRQLRRDLPHKSSLTTPSAGTWAGSAAFLERGFRGALAGVLVA